ncbi:MAG: gliding motility-associated C-terminal domain-containing protein, partial [Bacteroidetes bacterium]
PPDSLDLLLHNGLDAFRHRLRIRATGFEAGQTSLSNELEFRFGHPVFIPNVFSPNGDGIHDLWVIENLLRYPQNELRVYDRWGRSVFSREGYQNDWGGEQLPEGVYYYHFSPGPGVPLRKGTVTLLR